MFQQVNSRSGKPHKFVVVSNARCGSTWLITALGALPDVTTDYELKWNVSYEPSPVHLVLNAESSPVAEMLAHVSEDRIGEEVRIVGAKFVFDPKPLNRLEFAQLRGKFNHRLKVVHIVRRYRDVFLSSRRGFYHQLNPSSQGRVGRHLREAIVSADAARRANGTTAALHVSASECRRELRSLLRNDLWIARLAALGVDYLRVDYDDISRRMLKVARFIGSRAPTAAIAESIVQPPTVKLAATDPQALVANIRELDPLFQRYEALRAQLIAPRWRRRLGILCRPFTSRFGAKRLLAGAN